MGRKFLVANKICRTPLFPRNLNNGLQGLARSVVPVPDEWVCLFFLRKIANFDSTSWAVPDTPYSFTLSSRGILYDFKNIE